MIGPEQKISDNLRLVAPDIDRDPPLGVGWMSGSMGRETQRLMGIPLQDIHDHDLEEERRLIKFFIDTESELVWMIEQDQTVVGAVEIGLKIPKEEYGPSFSIMIGDPAARARGIGKKVMSQVIEYLRQSGYKELRSRYIRGNMASEAIHLALGFVKVGNWYTDDDGVTWQNLKKDLS